MNRGKLGFLLLSFLIVIALFGMIFYVVRSENRYKKQLVMPIGIGIITIAFYDAFLIASDYLGALILEEIYFICTDWLTFTMLIFTAEYTGIVFRHKKNSRLFGIAVIMIILVDSVSLLLNTVTHHSFDISWQESGNGIYYWSLHLEPVHLLHLGFCYLLVLGAFFLLIISIRKMPDLYKNKYNTILGAYTIVIVVNLICYSMDLLMDVSVLFYAILAGFICYYSTYGFPLQLLNRSLRDVMRTISEGIVYYDADDVCIFMNDSAQTLFSDKDKEYTYASVQQYHDDVVMEKIANQQDIEWKDSFQVEGKLRHYLTEFQKVYYKGSYVGYFLRFRDITRETNGMERERYLATHDTLTGLYNREAFLEEADKLLQKDSGTERIMLYTNIKDFKMLNSMFGTAIGDAVLKKQADILKKYSEFDILCGRIIDDKIAILMRAVDFSKDHILKEIEEIHKIVESSVYQLHMYVGVYDPQGQKESAKVMCDKAKMAIDEIAGDYRQVFAFYDNQLMEKLLLEKDIVNRFEEALYNRQFVMFLQPQVNAQGEMIGAEALVRWHHPIHGLLPPVTFVETLEKTGYIHYLDTFIWTEAAKLLSTWKSRGREDIYISVNVSPRDFYYLDIYEVFVNLVQKYDIEPSKLKIEITETVLLTDYDKALKLFTALQEYGFKIEIDDFGSGYSSLNMLKGVKANVLKIDMSFLKQTNDAKRARIVLSSIINMADKLHMDVVTEGVETKEQEEMLCALGCHIFQGYYYSRPVPIAEFEKKYHLQ